MKKMGIPMEMKENTALYPFLKEKISVEPGKTYRLEISKLMRQKEAEKGL